jgi:hypothetical protein
MEMINTSSSNPRVVEEEAKQDLIVTTEIDEGEGYP